MPGKRNERNEAAHAVHTPTPHFVPRIEARLLAAAGGEVLAVRFERGKRPAECRGRACSPGRGL